MTLWLILTLMTVVATAAVIWPLLRHGVATRSGSDVMVYRDQLDEVGRDLASGLIGKTEAEAARVEISRRLIAAADAAQKAPTPAAAPTAWRRWAVAAITLMLVPLGATGLYLRLGSPGLASEPLAARMEAPATNKEQSVEKMIAQVEQHLQSDPKDGRGWEVIAPVYMQVGRYTDSVNAWRNAIKILGRKRRPPCRSGRGADGAGQWRRHRRGQDGLRAGGDARRYDGQRPLLSGRRRRARRQSRKGRPDLPQPHRRCDSRARIGSAPCRPRWRASKASPPHRRGCRVRPRPKCWRPPSSRRRSRTPPFTAWSTVWRNS